MKPDRERVRAEIEDLHRFFARWLCGDCEKSAWSRLTDALEARFALISTEGEVLSREALLDMLHARYASHTGANTFEIWTEHCEVRARQGDVVIATYEEWQKKGEVTRGRHSTVVFVDDDRAPNGLRWLHVHETWLSENHGSS